MRVAPAQRIAPAGKREAIVDLQVTLSGAGAGRVLRGGLSADDAHTHL